MSSTRPHPLCTAIWTLFCSYNLYGVYLIWNQSFSHAGSSMYTTSALYSTPVSSATIGHMYNPAQLCWIAPIFISSSSHFGLSSSLWYGKISLLLPHLLFTSFVSLPVCDQVPYYLSYVPRLPGAKCCSVTPSHPPLLLSILLKSPALWHYLDDLGFLCTRSIVCNMMAMVDWVISLCAAAKYNFRW